MAHVAAPHFIDKLGMVAGLLAITSALILRFALDRDVPDRYPALVALSGVVMALLHMEAVTGLAPRTVIYFRWVAIAIAMVAGPGSVLWVLDNIEPEDASETEERMLAMLEELEARFARRIK